MIKIQGIASQGGVNISTSGTLSSTESIGSFPGSTVTIYNTGTTNLATIYSDAAGTPKANPFSSSSTDASWSCYVARGRYDVRFSGTGITSPFTLSDFVVAPLEYTLEEFGAIGDNVANDTAAINAAFAALPHGYTLRLKPGAIYSHTGLTFDHKFQCTIVGNDSLDGYADPPKAPTFVYKGASGGTAITLSNVYGCTFRGFISYAASTNTVPGTTGAAKNLYVTFTGGGDPPTSSQCVFQSLTLRSIGTRTDHRALSLSNASGTNNEFHSIRDCKLQGGSQGFGLQTGSGIYIGHGNVKQTRIERTSFDGFAKGIESLGGSFGGWCNTFNSCATNYSGTFGDACIAIRDDSEGSTQLIDCTGNSGQCPIKFVAGRYDALHGGQAASGTTSTTPIILGGGILKFEGCQFAPVSSGFNSNFILNSSAGNSTIKWNNNWVVGISVADLCTGLDTFLYSVDDVHAQLGVRGAVSFAGTNNYLIGATPDLSLGNLGGQYSVRYTFNNGGTPTSVTNFINGLDGQLIILKGDTMTTLVNGTSIKTISGSNITPWTSNKLVILLNDGGVWKQTGGTS